MFCCPNLFKKQNKPIVGTTIVKTLYIVPVFRTSLTPITIEEEEKTHAVIVTFERPNKKNMKGSISSLGSQPITVNLSQAAKDDPAPTPSPAVPMRKFSFNPAKC